MKFTEQDRQAALKAHQDLHGIRQAIGSLGPRLRRTKPGSKRHKAYYDSLTKLESEASELSSTVAMFLRTVAL